MAGTLVLYRTTRCPLLEDSSLYCNDRENLHLTGFCVSQQNSQVYGMRYLTFYSGVVSIQAFCDVSLHRPMNIYWSCEGTYYRHVQGRAVRLDSAGQLGMVDEFAV